MDHDFDNELRELYTTVENELSAENILHTAAGTVERMRAKIRKALDIAGVVEIAELPQEYQAQHDENIARMLWLYLATEPVFMKRIQAIVGGRGAALSAGEMFAELAALLNSAGGIVPLTVSVDPPKQREA